MSDHSDTTLEKEPTLEKWQVDFLKWLARKGNVSAACRKAKIDRKWAYEKRDRDPFFRAAWDEALEIAVEAMEEEARRRAVDGVAEYDITKGKDGEQKKVLVGRKYSDTLLIFLLKAHRPKKYRENHRHEHVIPPVTLQHDFSKLTTEELRQLRELQAKLEGGDKPDDAVSA